MSPYETAVAVAPKSRVAQFAPSALDLNDVVRGLAASRDEDFGKPNITVTLDLAEALPRIEASSEMIRYITGMLFNYVQNNVQKTGAAGNIAIRTSVNPGRVICSIGYVGPMEACFESPELIACADAVSDLGGYLYAWKPHMSGRLTITVELPA